VGKIVKEVGLEAGVKGRGAEGVTDGESGKR